MVLSNRGLRKEGTRRHGNGAEDDHRGMKGPEEQEGMVAF